MSLEPPPRIVDKFVNIWRDWLYFFWEFVDEHTGGSSPTPPATGTSWNAHGNTAVSDGDAANFLKVEHGSLWVDGSNSVSGFLGDYPSGAEYQGSGSESKMLFIADKGAFRAGKVTGTAWDDAQIGQSSFAAGAESIASGTDTVTIGTNSINNATNNAVIMGIDNEITSAGIFALCFGHQNYLNFFNTACLGTWLEAQASGSFVIGKGQFPGAGRLVNNVPNSLMIGLGSTTPTFTLLNGRCAVSTTANVITDPLSTFDIGGSVGFQYTPIDPTVSGDTYTITGNEYTFRIDVSGLTQNTDFYNIQLPVISSGAIDRRIYYFKVTDMAESNGNHGSIRLIPGAAQYIEDFGGGVGHRLLNPLYLEVTAGESITVIANNTDSTWWVI